MSAPEQSRPAVEPWLRGTWTEVPALARAVLHALQLAEENIMDSAAPLTDAEIHAKPYRLTPFAFHVRHIAHSLDRLLTYAEGEALNMMQRAALSVELEPGISKEALLAEFTSALREASARIRSLPLDQLQAARYVGERRLPVTLGGLLVHLADHTQRHAGQALTTARLLVAQRAG